MLLNANAMVPFDRLVDLLWEVPPQSARQQIHNVMGSLRRALSPLGGAIEIKTVDVGYRMTVPETWVDLYRFRAAIRGAEQAEASGVPGEAVRLMREALGWWRGPALAGLQSRPLMNIAARLQEDRLAVVERLMALRLELGEAGSLVSELMELVAEHPLRESLRATFMAALYRSGRQADALSAYDNGRRILAEELGVDPGPQLRYIHAQILSGTLDADYAAGRETALHPPAEQPGPANYLPHDIGDFTGRAAEIDEVLRQVRGRPPGALVISGIDGMGGVGKTTFAVHLAHELAREYPDGQYFVDLRGFSAGMEPLAPAHALELLLRDGGVPPELVPPDLEGRSAMWRARTAGQRAMLLLDNAADIAQVRPLLPGSAGMLVIITSRRRLTVLDGSLSLSLDLMPLDEAVNLFTSIVGADRAEAEPEAVHEAVRLCGQLPLAIRIAAARLRDRKGWTVAHLVERLRDQQHRMKFLVAGDRSVMRALVVSYRYLNEAQRRMFRLLSLHPGNDFDAYAAAALAGCGLEEAERDLEVLFENHLLLQRVPGRYEFHDLVRDCSGELLDQFEDDAGKQDAIHRVLDYYLYSASLWCRPIAAAPYTFELEVAHLPMQVKECRADTDALRVLDVEHRNLVRAAQYAGQHGWITHTWQFACVLRPYFSHTNYGGAALELYTSALQAARRQQDLPGEAACLAGLASVHRARGANAKGRELLEQAIEISRNLGDKAGEGRQLTLLGIMHANDDQFGEAVSSFSAALAISDEIGDEGAQADLANNLGVICRDLGRFDEALRYFRRTQMLDRAGDTRQTEVLTAGNIAMLLHLQGRNHEAIAQFEEILSAGRSVGNLYSEAFTLVGLCSCHRSIGELEVSLAYGRDALTLTRRSRLYDLECAALNVLGETLTAFGRHATAEDLFRQAQALADRHRATRHVARANEGLAHLCLARGDLSGARRHWEQALQAYPEEMYDARIVASHLDCPDLEKSRCPRCESLPAL
ncbi:AfsR/SARP family transcriptional regulator [Planobispora takensis]|uniref:AfsR/SARP family transcriptional regulator n=1 Tax=Planobispora takensis TaxID=1367882 RepID=UPI0019413B36|nr:BTAD domain-containing putative transcriptional regulator [Planobispora takensis]